MPHLCKAGMKDSRQDQKNIMNIFLKIFQKYCYHTKETLVKKIDTTLFRLPFDRHPSGFRIRHLTQTPNLIRFDR